MGRPKSGTGNTRKHEKTRENTEKRHLFLAPCSAFLTKVSKSSLSTLLDEKALQGAGKGRRKTRKTRENTEKTREKHQIQAALLVPSDESEQKLTFSASGEKGTTGCGDPITENTGKAGKARKSRPRKCPYGTRLSSMQA